MLPPRWERDRPADWWVRSRERVFRGFRRCPPALAGAGNDLIVDTLVESRARRRELAELLRGLHVWLVAVHCDLEQLDRRESERVDRRFGEGRTHVEVDGIHTFGTYDLEVDTTTSAPSELARIVVQSWNAAGEGPSASYEIT